MFQMKPSAPLQDRPPAPWDTAIKRDIPGGGRSALVLLVDLLRWIAHTERLGGQEALSDMLLRLEANPQAPLYLAWTFQPVELIERQDFGLRTPDGTDHAEALLSGEPVRDGLPVGVTLGRSAALFRFRRGLQDVFVLQDLEVELSLASDIYLDDPKRHWVVMAMTAEDASLLFGAAGTPFHSISTYNDLVVMVSKLKTADPKARIPWTAEARSVLREEITRREKRAGLSFAQTQIGRELGGLSRAAIANQAKS
jgi:hypothetical protein